MSQFPAPPENDADLLTETDERVLDDLEIYRAASMTTR